MEFLKEYRNGIIYGVVCILFITYSVFLWRTAGAVKDRDYFRERTELQKQIISTKESNEQLVASVGATIDAKLSKLKTTNTYITKEVRSEIDKNPVYTECHNSPTVVRNIESAIDGENSATGK